MTEAEFWSSTPRWFSARRAAYIEQQKSEWKRMRMICYYTAKTVDTKDRFKSPEDMIQFSWEMGAIRRAADRPPTEEEIAALEKFSREADEWYYAMHPEHRPKAQEQDGSSQ